MGRMGDTLRVISDCRFQIADWCLLTAFTRAEGGNENGNQLVAFGNQCVESSRFYNLGLANQLEPIQCFVSFTQHNSQSRDELFPGGGANGLAVICPYRGSRPQYLSSQNVR